MKSPFEWSRHADLLMLHDHMVLGADDLARQKRAFLSQPLPKIDDPRVRVRVLAPFNLGAPDFVPARYAVPDEVVALPATLVNDLVARKLVQRL